MLDNIQMHMLTEVADLHGVPEGAYNFRVNGEKAGRNTTANIDIATKTDGKSGIDIRIKDGTKNESVHIPVVLSESGIKETVYNDFYVGDDCDVVIVAGCGIHNCGNQDSQHDGVHRFYVGKNSRVRYVEKHYGEGDGKGKRILNPVTEVYQQADSYVDMEMVQIKGVDSTHRITKAELAEGATMIVHERLMTHGDQVATSVYEVIHDENWDEADKKLDDLVKKLDRQKDFWLKVLDHQYYDDLNLELGLAKNAVYCKNKIRGLESLEKVESILQNLMADEKCNWNYIF